MRTFTKKTGFSINISPNKCNVLIINIADDVGVLTCTNEGIITAHKLFTNIFSKW